jgi:CHAT domain-containing protein/tetratricopeptide (TPR) repeat protein
MVRNQAQAFLLCLLMIAGVASGSQCDSVCRVKAIQESATLDSLAGVAKKAKEFAQAENLYRQSLAIRERSFGPDHLDVAVGLNNLAALLWGATRYADAERLFRRSLAIRVQALGPDNLSVATALNNLASLLSSTGRKADAETLYRRSLAIREQKLGLDHPDVATSLDNLALVIESTGRHAEAEPMFRRSLAIRERVLGPVHPDVATSLTHLAELLQSTGHYDEAETLHRRSLAIREEIFGPVHTDVAQSLNNLAAVLQSQGRYADAEPLFRRALAIFEVLSGPDHHNVATTLSNLASLLRSMGRFDDAEPMLRRSLAIDEKALGLDHPAVAVDLNNLANLYFSTGRYYEAETSYRRSLGIVERILGPDHLNVATSLNNLAGMLRTIGRYADAESLYTRSLAIKEKKLGLDHPDVATSLNNLAGLFRVTGRNEEAERLYERSLAIDEKVLGPDHPDVATLLNNLAEAYRSTHRFAEAESLYNRSMAIKEKVLGSVHPEVALSLNNLADLFRATGRRADAELMLGRALRIVVNGADPAVLWRIQSNLRSFYSKSHPDLAILYGKQAVNTIQGLRANLKNGKESSQSYLESVRDVYTSLSDLLVSQGRIPEAQQVLALLKGQEATEFLRGSSDTGIHNRLTLDSLEAAWDDSLRQAGGRRARVSAELRPLKEASAKSNLDPTSKRRLDSLEVQKEREDRDFDAVVVRLKEAFAKVTDLQRSQILSQMRMDNIYGQMVSKLDSGTVLLQYLLLDSTGQVLVTNRNKVTGHRLKVGSKQLNRLVADFVQALRDPHQDPRPLGRKLYDQLIAPVAADLDSARAKTVMFSLDGTLRYIPMAALYDGEKYLVERYALSVYTEGSQNAVAEKPAAAWTVAGLGNSRAAPGFDSLPAVRKELHGIVREKSGDQGVLPGIVRLDTAFTKRAFQTALDTHYPVVHLASHFKFSPYGEYDSYLLLGDSSRLDLHELRTGPYSFRGVDLLTLSACQTAVIGSRNANGIEIDGMAGIAQSRGAKAVMATLWPVVDASTQSFMQEFYRDHGDGLTKAAALRKAQLAFLQGSGKEVKQGKPNADGLFIPPSGVPYAHPYYWAPFILMGNWL